MTYAGLYHPIRVTFRLHILPDGPRVVAVATDGVLYGASSDGRDADRAGAVRTLRTIRARYMRACT